jgi:hypothetical protein
VRIAIALVILYLAGSWAWHMHCFFFFHVWDESRTVADVCLRCGEIRFK